MVTLLFEETLVTKPVVTYRLANVGGQVSLCDECVDEYNKYVPLGPVSHGLHDGACESCDIREQEKSLNNQRG